MPTKKKKAATKKAAKKTKATPARTTGKKRAAKKAASKLRKAPAAPKKKKAAPAKKAASKKAAPAKVAAKKKAAPAKKAAPKKAASKPGVARAKPGVARTTPIQRRDHAGHIDPKYAAELLAKGSSHDAATDSFVNRPRSSDALVEELGEEFVEDVTTAEYQAEDSLNREVAEDVGGPFVETGGGTEFAPGTDASNPESATREPFPRS